jgi:acyl carrier protein
MAPKATAAWHLHELTKGIEGCELILFSSLAGTFQSPGQGNYAAANTFLDALAQRRQAEGLAGSSFAWGLWAVRGGSEEGIPIEVDLARASRGGIAEMSSEVGLGLFDRGHALGSPALLAAQLDLAPLRAMSRDQSPPALLRGLVRTPARRVGKDNASLATRLAAVPESEREGLAVELVRSQVAAVLGHSAADAIDPDAPFQDLGFDSLLAVELRNRLSQATGLRLSASLVFDYPTVAAVGGFLRGEVEGTKTPADTDRKLDSIAEILGSVPSDEKSRALARLQSLLAGLSSEGRNDGGRLPEVDLDSASDEELFELIDGELGSSR